MNKGNFGRGAGIGILAVLGFVAVVGLVGFVVQSLWNWLLPELFGLPLISFWQGLGLLVLTRLLFGGLGGPGGGRGKHRKHKNRGKHWKLSSEEKEHLEQMAAAEGDESQAD